MIVEVECFRHNPTFVKKVTSNGTIQLRKQCNICGKVEGKIYKHKEVENMEETPYLDELLFEQYENNLQELWDVRFADLQAKREMEWDRRQEQIREDADVNKEKYHNYLKSHEWFEKRNRIMAKYKFKCVLCFNRADIVHHLTYMRIFEEDERDMIPLCDSCHKFVHGYLNNAKKY